jgi:hypothetical protein
LKSVPKARDSQEVGANHAEMAGDSEYHCGVYLLYRVTTARTP